MHLIFMVSYGYLNPTQHPIPEKTWVQLPDNKSHNSKKKYSYSYDSQLKISAISKLIDKLQLVLEALHFYTNFISIV
ncbi:hypothetical protein BpHYR1_014853 [Brachionus plicatilis]|uniref:Uncharacterized protein n=1 Tax=Brachionus plicatilis TaxID=10195 RepID=A0A3M7Q8P4_BRAPC|nr:hypothetical protein BpHYR1_014853 [Brachionus plicatilis]